MAVQYKSTTTEHKFKHLSVYEFVSSKRWQLFSL